MCIRDRPPVLSKYFSTWSGLFQSISSALPTAISPSWAKNSSVLSKRSFVLSKPFFSRYSFAIPSVTDFLSVGASLWGAGVGAGAAGAEAISFTKIRSHLSREDSFTFFLLFISCWSSGERSETFPFIVVWTCPYPAPSFSALLLGKPSFVRIFLT